MIYIKMKPREYRVFPILAVVKGFPKMKFLLQVQTRMGWSTIHDFWEIEEANKALKEWKETLNED